MASYDFVYMGDTWIAKSNTSSLINYTGEFVFNEVLVQAKKRNPRFVLHGGDAVFAGDRPSLIYFKQQKVKKVFSSTKFFVAPGNHDALYQTVNGKTRISFASFKQIIGPLDFTIKAPDLKVVVLNTQQIVRNGQGNDRIVYGLSNQQLNFLRRELANTKARFKVVSTHVPPEEWDKSPQMNAIKQRFLKILSQYHVSMVLLSHEHEFKRYKVNNIPYIISGGAGAALNVGQLNHFVLLSVRGDKLTAKQIKVGWLDNRGFATATGTTLVRRTAARRLTVRGGSTPK